MRRGRQCSAILMWIYVASLILFFGAGSSAASTPSGFGSVVAEVAETGGGVIAVDATRASLRVVDNRARFDYGASARTATCVGRVRSRRGCC